MGELREQARTGWEGMSFRRRLTLAGAGAVAVAIALVSLSAALIVRAELRRQVDDELRESAERVRGPRFIGRFELPADGPEQIAPDQGFDRLIVPPGAALGGRREFVQLLIDGEVFAPGRAESDPVLRPTAAALAVAARGEGEALTDDQADGAHVRVMTAGIEPGRAIQIARNVEDTDAAITRLSWVLAAVSLGGVGLAAGLGLVVTRTALRPVSQLSEAVEHVTRTRDLSRRIDEGGGDELSRLASSFNGMLGALEESMRSQRRLVADASHELRTPLTSLRTNVEVLAGANGMPEDDRRRLLADLVAQIEELTGLVGDLVELARDEERSEAVETLRLDELVEASVERARRRHAGREIELVTEPALVEGVPARLDRALANLLDNADKWSPPGGRVEVAVRGSTVTVRDHGPGIAADDLPHVFDRFYRSAAARGTPGSGLGLAIVRAVAEAHGGSVHAEAAAGGGARLVLDLPVAQGVAAV